ncbi:MAG TPA: integrase, partial [Candidatus Accumulibacter sp.]|nr:integrase [Accumulibacter sp.]
MNETRLCTIEQIEQFLSATASIEFSATGDDRERYGHISRVLTRFDYPGRSKRERGVLHRYLQHTSGYSR